MSYCRFGWDDSDVYVFGTIRDNREVLECCGCLLLVERDFICETAAQMVVHLLTHRRDGQTVPQDALDRLIAERDGTPYESTESYLDVMRRNPQMFGRTREEMDAVVDRLEEK